MTYPEIETFIDDHTRNRRPLDYEFYFVLVGVRYLESRPSANRTPLLGMGFTEEPDGHIVIANLSRDAAVVGPRWGDTVLALFDQEVSAATLDRVLSRGDHMRPGDPFTIRVLRDGDQRTFEGRLIERRDHHVLEVDTLPTEAQRRLRAVWMRNQDVAATPSQR